MEEAVAQFVNAAQTAPLLLKTVDNTLHSKQQIRKLTQVVYSSLAFKAHAASSANHVHPGSSGATERTPSEVAAEASDGLASSSEHHITIEQTITNDTTTINQLQQNQRKNIAKIVCEKNLVTLEAFGGLRGVADALNTDLEKGLSENEAIYLWELSLIPERNSFTYLQAFSKFFYLVWEEFKSKTILLLLLVVALLLELGIIEESLQNGWYNDGVVVLIAVILLVFFALIRKYCQEQRARKNFQKQQSTQGRVREVHVSRGGDAKYICESKLVCGDVVLLKKGCQVPSDGLFVGGQALELDYGTESYIINEQNPFLSYGERVINGDARMVVTSVNMDTGWSEMMSKATCDSNVRFKLETHIDRLNTCIHYTELIITILTILVLLLRYTAGKMDDENGNKPDSMAKPTATRIFANTFKKIIRVSKHKSIIKLLSVLLVGVTGGVPFVVSLTMSYWNDVTLSGKATEQDSQGVVKMASVTRICTDTFGNLTKDEMEVDKVFIGGEVISGCTTLSPNVLEALCDGICTLTEKAVLDWAKEKLGLKRGRKNQSLTKMYENELEKEILMKCTHYYNSKGEKAPMDDKVRRLINQANEDMLHKQLRTIAFAFKCRDTQTPDADDLVLVALLGLKKKNNEATTAEVMACRECGIETVIVSSKKVSVLEGVARQCGVNIIGDLECSSITGEVFRKYTEKERLEKVGKIRILGEALPYDKLLLVQTLRQKGEVVKFLGQRTDEAPALRGANIGIAMGTWSSIKARESCDIILWNGSFSDLISMVDSGKCIYHNIQRFLQPVLIVTRSSTLINFFETAALGDASLTTFQLVWVNLLVAFLGGLALLRKPSIDKPVSLVPVSCKRSLITTQMTRSMVLEWKYLRRNQFRKKKMLFQLLVRKRVRRVIRRI